MPESHMKTRRRVGSQSGFTLVELMVCLVAVGLLMTITVPSFYQMYRQKQVRNAAVKVSMLVRFAKLQAVKEKSRYKVVFKDENAGTSKNMANLEVESGGSFGAVTGQQHALAEPVKILGGGGYDSVDEMTVSRRGECTTGNVYIEGLGGMMMTVSISSTCAITYL